MVFLLLFFVELLLLFFLSHVLTKSLTRLWHDVTRSKTLSTYLLAILFFPGVVIHELSHWLMAELLRVPTGKIELLPAAEHDSIKLGSVQIAKSDPIRRFLIGIAPLFFGTPILLGIIYYFGDTITQHTWWQITLIGYVVFVIGNTMFSSKKDLEGALELFIVIAVIAAALYFIGIRPPAISDSSLAAVTLLRIFRTGTIYLLIPIGIDIVIILITRAFLKLFR